MYDENQINFQDTSTIIDVKDLERFLIAETLRRDIRKRFPDSGVVVIWIGDLLHVSVTAHPGVPDFDKLQWAKAMMDEAA